MANKTNLGDFYTSNNELNANATMTFGNSSVNVSINSTTIILGPTVTLTANSSNGTSGQVLTSNGSAVYWSVAAAGVNVAAQYTWTNTQTFTNTITFNSTIVGTTNNALYLGGSLAANYVQNTDSRTLSGNLIFSGANNTLTGNFRINSGATILDSTGSQGTTGQILTSNGSGNVYWSAPPSGSFSNGTAYTFTATESFVAAQALVVNGAISANGSNGTSTQVLTSAGTGNVYWASTSGGGATLNANNSDTSTYYVGLSSANSGSWTNAVVATSKLYFVPSTGTLSATIFNSLSDEQQKTNIQKINNSLEILNSIEGVSFNWKETGAKSYGVIAQQIEKVLPEIVSENENTKSVNYDALIGFLIEAVKDLSEEVNRLKNGK